jgi:hypothetical protein
MPDQLVDDLKRALGDAYTIERELTGGGMSRVFVAREHALGREVVIKVLPPDLAAGVNRDRFRREVQLAARLSHPYIVPLLHAGEHEELLWFTMPYIPGESLRTRLQREGAFQLPEVIRLLRDVVEALAYAHSRGVIHRDIKPGNILSDGQHALVTDFGVAKALNAALPLGGPGHTTSGMAIGTPAYMAPEQLAADPDADHRVDIYAVGLLAYELLSGASPFAAPSPTATMTAQLTQVPEPLHQLRSDVSPAFSQLVQHCLAKAPEDRPPDANAVLAEINRISGAMAADAHRSVSGETAATRRASSWPLAFAALGALALIGGGLWWTRRPPPPPRHDTSSVRLGSDTGDLAVLPPARLTHKDSLAIAEALRSELQELDPKRVAAKPRAVDTVPLDQQLHQTDSIVRAVLAERTGPPAPAPTATSTATTTPRAPAVPGTYAVTPASPLSTPAPGDATARRLLLIPLPVRDNDSTLRRLQSDVVSELSRRANQGDAWDAITIDSGMTRARSPSDRNGAPPVAMSNFGPGSNSDVRVILGFDQGHNDSVTLRIMVRRSTAGSSFGYRVLTSDAQAHPTSTTPFRNTIRDASRLLEQLRRLPPGQAWVQDMGRNGRGGGPVPGGPYFPSMNLRTFTQGQIDSLRHLGDSLSHRYRIRKDS